MHRQYSTRSDTRYVIGETEGDDGGSGPPPEPDPPVDDPEGGESPLSPVFDAVGEENAYLGLVAVAGGVGAVVTDTTP